MFKIIGSINYLAVVFLNAFTDLGHKIIIQNTIFKVYDGSEQIVLTAIVNALILLPFLLVFSPAGFLADRFPKHTIMKYSSVFAVVITLFITFSYYQGWFFTAFTFTFVLAMQSAIYGPAKYGYIKELFGLKYISSANAAVQATTTVAILLGIIVYTVLFESIVGDNSSYTKDEIIRLVAPLGWLLVISSLVEFFLSLRLPNKVKYTIQNRFILKKYILGTYLKKNILKVKRKLEIYDAILVLGLFWSISQVVLAVFPEYVKSDLNITNTIVVQGMMALAVIGIVLGSLLAAKFSKYYINTGLATLGAIGIMIIVFGIPSMHSVVLLSFSFAFFGLFSGLILVPLNAKIQQLSPNIHLGTILAGNNFIQTVFMFSFLVLTTIFAYVGLSSKSLFYIMGLVSLYLVYKLFKRYFIMTFWALIELILRSIYRFEYKGLNNIPVNGAILLLGNHVSWIDWFILQYPIQRRISFMLDKDIYNKKLLNSLFRLGGLIPISPKASKDAFIEASKRLKNGSIVAIFPEGAITKTNEMSKFYKGYELIDKDYDGIIIPYFIDGLAGSIFSRYKDKKTSLFTKRVITLYFGKAQDKYIKADDLKEVVKGLK